jgi:dynein heavy chain
MSLPSRSGTQGRPRTQNRKNSIQRGFYSEVISSTPGKQIAETFQQGPKPQLPNIVSIAHTDHHLPSVTKFKSPNNIATLLSSQKYGPTTQIISCDEFPQQSWDPKVQVSFNVESGKTPRRVEIERRKRIYSQQHISQLLSDRGIHPSNLMPVADTTSHSLISNGKGKSHSPTFPSFLPLEVFDNMEYDCRTPAEWVALG